MSAPLVVIPALNEEYHIEACLRSLLDHDEMARLAMVVVVDGGSSDATREIVAALARDYPNVSLMDNPRRIQAAAINLAARRKGEGRRFLVRCDAHAIYPANYISRLVEAIERTQADSVVTPMDAVGEGCFQRAAAWIVDTPLGNGGAAHRGGTRSGYVDHGHHAIFDLARFTALGGYDETFTHNEDAEYDRRLTLAGGKIWLDADIRFAYIARATPRELWRQYSAYGAGRASMLAKHGLMPAPRQLIPVLNLALLAASFAFTLAVAALMAAWPDAFMRNVGPLRVLGSSIGPFAIGAFPIGFGAIGLGLLWPGLYGLTLLGASAATAISHRSACGLGAGPALAIMHNAWACGFIGARPRTAREPTPALERP